MREIRPSGSEGGGTGTTRPSLPLSHGWPPAEATSEDGDVKPPLPLPVRVFSSLLDRSIDCDISAESGCSSLGRGVSPLLRNLHRSHLRRSGRDGLPPSGPA